MKKSATLSLGCLIAFAAFAQAQTPIKTEYYPLEIGKRWTYRHIDMKAPQGKAAPKRTVVIEVERDEPYVEKKTVKGTTTEKKYAGFLLKMTSGDKTTRDHVVVTEEGVCRVQVADTAITPPVLFLKFSVKPGETWKCDSVSGNTAIKGTFTFTGERVRVPHGEYDALHISFQGENQVAFDNWFVEKIGVVKHRVRGKNFDIVMELEKVETAK